MNTAPMERVALIGAVLSLPITIGKCSEQALTNKALELDIAAKSQAIVQSAQAFAAKDSALKVAETRNWRLQRKLNRCLKKHPNALRDEPAGYGPPPPREAKSYLAKAVNGVQWVAKGIGNTVVHLFGFGG